MLGALVALAYGTSALAADEPTVKIVSAPHKIKLATFLTKGYRFKVTFSGDCHSIVVFVVSKGDAKRLHLGKSQLILGSFEDDVNAGTFTATLDAKRVAKKLKGHKRVPGAFGLTCVSSDGHEDLDSIPVTITG